MCNVVSLIKWVHGMGNELIKSILMVSQVHYSKTCALMKKLKNLKRHEKKGQILITQKSYFVSLKT